MHYRLIVTTDLENAKTSEQARSYINSELSNDDSFVGEGGRFSSPIADWFVIGGRWSGELQQLSLKKDFNEESKKILGDSQFISTQDVEDNKEKLQKLWEELGGKDTNPYNRDTYNENGYEDDAMILTADLYKKLLKEYEGEWGKGETSEDSQDGKYHWKTLHFIDLKESEVNPKNYVGKKWIVIVDYHN